MANCIFCGLVRFYHWKLFNKFHMLEDPFMPKYVLETNFSSAKNDKLRILVLLFSPSHPKLILQLLSLVPSRRTMLVHFRSFEVYSFLLLRMAIMSLWEIYRIIAGVVRLFRLRYDQSVIWMLRKTFGK